MIIKCLFGQRKAHGGEQLAPELVVAWDEYCIEENGDGFDADCSKGMENTDFEAFAFFDIEVDGEAIRSKLCDTVKLKGTIKS